MFPLALNACGGSSSTDSTGPAASRGTAPRSDRSVRIRDFGREATGSQARRAEAVVLDYLRASAAAQWGTACSYLSKPTRGFAERIAADAQRAEGAGNEVTDCAAVVREVTRALSARRREALAQADPRAVRAGGRRGYVIYAADGAEYAMPTVREGDRWKLSSLTAIGLSS